MLFNRNRITGNRRDLCPSLADSIVTADDSAVASDASRFRIMPRVKKTARCVYTYLCRGILIVLLCVAWFFQTFLDRTLHDIWRVLRENPFFQHDSFEPLVVSVSFFFSMGLYYILDIWIPSAKRWRIQKEHTDMQAWKLEHGGRFKNEILWYWIPIALFDVLYPRRSLPFAAPSFWQLVLEVLASLLVYDALFFCFHLAFHKVPFLYNRFHAKHHTKKVVRACEAMRLSLTEEVVDVGCSIAAINLLRCHPMSRALYNACIVYLITELHSGYDFPWMLQNVVPFGIWAGSRRHDHHHRYGTRYYQKFFTYLDDVCDLLFSYD